MIGIPTENEHELINDIMNISLMKTLEFHAYTHGTTMEEVNDKLLIKLDTFEFYFLLYKDYFDYDDIYYTIENPIAEDLIGCMKSINRLLKSRINTVGT